MDRKTCSSKGDPQRESAGNLQEEAVVVTAKHMLFVFIQRPSLAIDVYFPNVLSNQLFQRQDPSSTLCSTFYTLPSIFFSSSRTIELRNENTTRLSNQLSYCTHSTFFEKVVQDVVCRRKGIEEHSQCRIMYTDISLWFMPKHHATKFFHRLSLKKNGFLLSSLSLGCETQIYILNMNAVIPIGLQVVI